MWDVDDISFEIMDDMTDDPVATIVVSTPSGSLLVAAEIIVEGEALRLRGAHVQGAKPGAIGMANLLVIGQAVLRRMDYDELIVEGAPRTTGARPGHRPRSIRIRRRVLPPRSA